MSAKDGGPAFPRSIHGAQIPGNNEWERATYGMTLRDWFAGQALIGILRDPSDTSKQCAKYAMDDIRDGKPLNSFTKIVAASCYAYADALLAEREKK